MPRSFRIVLTTADDLSFQDEIFVADDDDVRFHDLAIVVEKFLANVRARGSDRVPTKSQVEAEQARVKAANAVLADWEPTTDGVNVEMNTSTGQQAFSRTWTKKGCDTPVSAPCDRNGLPTFATADVLGTWEAPMAEA